MSESARPHILSSHEQLVSALREVLTDGGENEKSILIRRIPFICNDIVWIKRLVWALLTANSAVLLALVTLAIQRAFS